MTKCIECKYFDPQCNDCNKDDHYAYRDDEACDKFAQRKECEHRYENCDINGCSIICHRSPSECGCNFYYECKLDNRYCDEKCEFHKDRHDLNVLREEKSNLYKAKVSIEKSIERYENMIKELESKIEKENKND